MHSSYKPANGGTSYLTFDLSLLSDYKVAAVELQAKLAQIEKDRNERLEKFQQDVCERVKRVRRQKLNEQMKKSIENVSIDNMKFLKSFKLIES